MKRLFYSLIILFLFVQTIFAQSYEKMSGLEIMQKMTNQSNWDDMSGVLVMELTNKSGDKRIRNMNYYSKQKTENEYQMLMKFVSPADVKGTAFLSIEQSDRDDDRYLYLPALRRVKKITSSGKGGNFMSSDFTYYDIGKPKIKDWKYNRLTDENIENYDCFVVEAVPATDEIKKDTGYGKTVHWIRKDTFTTYKATYFDRDGRKWKTLDVPKVEKIKNVWFSTVMIMQDLETGHTSKMEFQNFKINTGIPDNNFTIRYLQRR